MILVMNAGGNIGKELVRELKSRNADFTAAFRSPEQAEAARQAGLKSVVADYTKPDTLTAALAGAEHAFVVTPPVREVEELEGNFVEAAQQAGVQHLVKLSVWGAEQEATIFARPHRAVEKRIEAAGIPYTFLRPTGFMQNMLGNAGTIKSDSAYYLPSEDARVAEIDVRDIARVAAVALTKDGHIGKAYDLSGPESMTHTRRAEILSEVLGRKIQYVSPPEADWKTTMLGYGLPEWQVDGLLDLLRYYKTGASDRVSPSVQEVTGQKPLAYRKFVEDHAEAFR